MEAGATDASKSSVGANSSANYRMMAEQHDAPTNARGSRTNSLGSRSYKPASIFKAGSSRAAANFTSQVIAKKARFNPIYDGEFHDMDVVIDDTSVPGYRDANGMTDVERAVVGLPSIAEASRLRHNRAKLQRFLIEQEYLNSRVRWSGVRAMLKFDVTQKKRKKDVDDMDQSEIKDQARKKILNLHEAAAESAMRLSAAEAAARATGGAATRSGGGSAVSDGGGAPAAAGTSSAGAGTAHDTEYYKKALQKMPKWEEDFLVRNALFVEAKNIRLQHLKEWHERMELDQMRSKPIVDVAGLHAWYRTDGSDTAKQWPSRGHYLYKRACVSVDEKRQLELRRAEELIKKDADKCSFKPDTRNPKRVAEFYQNWEYSTIGKTGREAGRSWRSTPSFAPKPRFQQLQGPREVYEGFLRESPDVVRWNDENELPRKMADLDGFKERQAAVELVHPNPVDDWQNAEADHQGIHGALLRDNLAHQKFIEDNHFIVTCLPNPTGFGKVFPSATHPVLDVAKDVMRQAARQKTSYVERTATNVFHVEASPEMLAAHQARKERKAVLDTGLTLKQKKRFFLVGQDVDEDVAAHVLKLEQNEERAWRIAVHRMARMGNAPRPLVELLPTNKADTELAALEAIFADDDEEEKEEAAEKTTAADKKADAGVAAAASPSGEKKSAVRSVKKVSRAASDVGRVTTDADGRATAGGKPLWEQNPVAQGPDIIKARKVRAEMAKVSPWERQAQGQHKLQVKQLGLIPALSRSAPAVTVTEDSTITKSSSKRGPRTDYAALAVRNSLKGVQSLYNSSKKRVTTAVQRRSHSAGTLLPDGLKARGFTTSKPTSTSSSRNAPHEETVLQNFEKKYDSARGTEKTQLVEDVLAEGVNILAKGLGVKAEDVGDALAQGLEQHDDPAMGADAAMSKAVAAVQRASDIAGRGGGASSVSGGRPTSEAGKPPSSDAGI